VLNPNRLFVQAAVSYSIPKFLWSSDIKPTATPPINLTHNASNLYKLREIRKEGTEKHITAAYNFNQR